MNGVRQGAAAACLLAGMMLIPVARAEPAPEWVMDARAAAGSLAGALMPALQKALIEDGPEHAVRVCRQKAPELAGGVSSSSLRIGRTALRVRNPANTADAWEREVLDDFQRRIEAGEDPASMESWRVAEDGTGRWMKAIPTAPLCTTCHGTDLDPELARTLQTLYPKDQATGFEVGDLRGAFTTTVTLPR